jgi:hypothetical protein
MLVYSVDVQRSNSIREASEKALFIFPEVLSQNHKINITCYLISTARVYDCIFINV